VFQQFKLINDTNYKLNRISHKLLDEENDDPAFDFDAFEERIKLLTNRMKWFQNVKMKESNIHLNIDKIRKRMIRTLEKTIMVIEKLKT
jgi:hypothetical protein